MSLVVQKGPGCVRVPRVRCLLIAVEERDNYKSDMDQLFLKNSHILQTLRQYSGLYVKFRVEFTDRCTKMSR
jgi:hypothetical protein